MPSSGINGPGLTALSIGGVLIYSGMKGFSVLKAAQNVVQGKSAGSGQSAGLPISSGDSPPVNSGPLPKGSYSNAGLEKLWIQAGGSQVSAKNAACHGMQESRGNPRAQSANPDGGTNVGLWQLDTKGVGAGHSIQDLMDPLINASITVRATNDGRNWSEWATPGC